MRSFAAILLFAALAAGFNGASADNSNDNFQSIDEQGGYRFGFNDGRLARQEERSAEGVVRGAYTYVDANGQIQLVTYTADKHNGFLVSGTNVPRAGKSPEVAMEGQVVDVLPVSVVQETPEVAAARAEHFEAIERVRLAQEGKVPADAVAPVEEIPVPVDYTPEVIEARAAHLSAHAAEVQRSGVPVNTPTVRYVVPSSHFHPDYLPYAYL